MEENKTPVEVLLERGQTYAKSSIQLFKFKATDKAADLISGITAGFVILILLLLLFVNLNIGIALWIGDCLGRIWLGFFILSGFYGITGLFFYLFRNRWIKKPVANAIITQLLKDEHLNQDQESDQST